MRADRTRTPILLVGSQADLGAVREVILKLGFSSVRCVSDGARALDVLRESGRLLVIADLHVNPISGLDVLRAIRADIKLQRTPFIMTTVQLSFDEAIVIKRAGADSLILRPFRPAALAAKIESVLARTGHIRGTVSSGPSKSFAATVGERKSRRFGVDSD